MIAGTVYYTVQRSPHSTIVYMFTTPLNTRHNCLYLSPGPLALPARPPNLPEALPPGRSSLLDQPGAGVSTITMSKNNVSRLFFLAVVHVSISDLDIRGSVIPRITSGHVPPCSSSVPPSLLFSTKPSLSHLPLPVLSLPRLPPSTSLLPPPGLPGLPAGLSHQPHCDRAGGPGP